MNAINRLASVPSAAYLYALNLDPISLAWEYLRRNPNYQRDFRIAETEDKSGTPGRWCLRQWANPRQDSRLIEPMWQAGARTAITFVRGRAQDSVSSFGFWAFAGHKVLRHDGDQLILTTRGGGQVRRVTMSIDLRQDDSIAISILAGPGFLARAQAAWELTQLFDPAFPGATAKKPRRPSPSAVTHMQILQALDGDAAGASVREIARAVFGASTDKYWGPDSVWRSRVRYLLNRGRALSARGYRRMVGAEEAVGCLSNDESCEGTQLRKQNAHAIPNRLTL